MSFNSKPNSAANINEATSLISSHKRILAEREAAERSGNTATRKLNQNFYANQLIMAMNDTRNKKEQNASIIILLIVNGCERFAYYGLLCNYVLYLNKRPLDWTSYNASTMLLIFMGITYVSSLIGGWVADSFLGKFPIICISYVIYIAGYSLFPLISYNEYEIPNFCQAMNRSDSNVDISVNNRGLLDEQCSWYVSLAVVTIGCAIGFVKANLGPFGADQIQSRGQQMVFKYFNWLYWSINLGSFLCFSVLAFLQQNYSFFYGFIIPWIVLAFSFLLFLSGSSCYVKQDSDVSVLSNIFKVIIEAFKSIKRQKNLVRQTQRERALLSESEDDNVSESASNHSGYYDSSSSMQQQKNISWLDNAKIRYGGRFDDNLVDDVKALKKIIILFAIMIPYWLVYLQIQTTFVIQGLHLKLNKQFNENTKSVSFTMPVAWLSIFDQLTVLIMIPALDYFVYPYMRKKFAFCESSRLVVGMALSAMSVILAGLLETYRVQFILEDPSKNTIIQVIANTTYEAANLSVVWQIPQYIVIGLGEVFCSVSAVYYAYSAAPKSMQSILMGLFYFFTGIGGFVGSISLSSFKSIIYSPDRDDYINCPTCKLNYYFYFIAALQIIGMFLFVIIDSLYSISRSKDGYEQAPVDIDVNLITQPPTPNYSSARITSYESFDPVNT